MLVKLLSGSILVASLLSQPLLAEQKIRQQGSTSATATGNNSFAASRVHQSATQNRAGNYNLQQGIDQKGQSSAAGNGKDNTVVSDISQDSVQNQARENQRANQAATGNATATGRNNRLINNTGQYNRQNQWSY
ncbi:MAG: hypothetical protein AAFY63_17175 [Cyanobacteria bacterium J06643_13]